MQALNRFGKDIAELFQGKKQETFDAVLEKECDNPTSLTYIVGNLNIPAETTRLWGSITYHEYPAMYKLYKDTPNFKTMNETESGSGINASNIDSVRTIVLRDGRIFVEIQSMTSEYLNRIPEIVTHAKQIFEQEPKKDVYKKI